MTSNTQEDQAPEDQASQDQTSQDQTPEAQQLSTEGSLRVEALRALASVAALAALVYGLWHGFIQPGAVRTSPPLVDVNLIKETIREICGAPTRDGRPVIIDMLYSDDKQRWIENAANRFARLCPNIHVRIKAMGDIESADAILSGSEEPTLWCPADELVVRYLESSAERMGRDAMVHIGERTSIAHSPLVVLTWRNHERVLEAISRAGAGTDGPWVAMSCARVPRDPDLSRIALEHMMPGRWIDWYDASHPPTPRDRQPRARPKALAGTPDYVPPFPSREEIDGWGRVKFVHASPSRSAAGLETLYMMAFDYALPPRQRAAAPERRPRPVGARTEGVIESSEHLHEEFQRNFSEHKDAFQRWLRRCEAGLAQTPRSAAHMTDSMFNVGPSRYHLVATYEQLVFEHIDTINRYEGSMENLRVMYPQPTIVNQHPVVSLLPEGPEHDAQREASKRWIGFLRSDDMQKLAIEHGFRPATPAVTISGYNVSTNPFLRLRRHGIRFHETLTEPPRLDGDVVQEIITLWADATGRN